MESKLISKSKGATFGFYFIMLCVAVGIFYVIDKVGMGLVAPVNPDAPLGGVASTHQQINTLLQVLIALSVVIITARTVGGIFRFLNQPQVIGEVVGGILLGPSFLGKYFPEAYHFLLPDTAIPFIGIIAQLGVIIYMFIVGLELDLKVLRRSGHATLAISHASIVCPFVLGGYLALKLYPEYSTSDVRFTSFALFLGVSMSVTAFPVLARILTDRKIQKTHMGTIALTCAAVDDATAWCLLALVVSIAQAKIGSALTTFVLTILYVLMMYFVARPLVAKLVPLLEKLDRITESGVAIIFVALLLSALSTELIGIHAIFGAFLLGAITPHNSRVAKELTERLEDLVRVMFLPAFFAFTGVRTQIGLLNTQDQWITCGLIIIVATIGKFGGTFMASKLVGLNWRDSAALGILMNTRGLVELIVLNLGLDLKIISPTLFTMLVIMALVTTFITSPMLSLFIRKEAWK
jgi:Kef-type K+ transport system membrane component KefB